ncbi:MAG: tyrosine-type recombinase/integrase [Leptospirillia bacterium]
MPLTELAIRNARTGEKITRMSDGGGLYLQVEPNGSKYWRLAYRFGGKQKTLSLGVYPTITLKDARGRRDEARRQLAHDIDPGERRKEAQRQEEAKVTNSFKSVALEWLPKMSSRKQWASSYSKKIARRLEVDLFPWLGERPIGEITPPELLRVLQRIEDRGAINTAHQVKQTCGQIFRYAIATGRAERDPSGDLKDALPPVRSRHFASITDPKSVGELLRAIDGFKGTFVVQCALRLAPLFFVRPGELRKAEWDQINLDKAEWRFTATKTRTDHLVPLARQAVAILRELHPLSGEGRFVFPGRDPKQPMSEAAVNAALRRLGYDTKTDITGHGFRAMARTIIAEELHVKPEVIEHQLAHKVPDILGTAYNRTKFLKERRAMMQQWADYLERLKDGAEIIPLRREA